MDKLFEVESNLEKANVREDRILEQKAKLINDVKDKENEIRMMKKRLYENENKMKAVMEDLNNFIENLKRERDDLKEKNEKMKAEMKEKDLDIEELEKDLMQNGKQFKFKRMDTHIEIDMNLKKQQNNLEKERANQLEKMVENMERELEKVRREENNLLQKNSDLREEIEELQRQVKQEQRNNDNLQNEVEMLHEDLRYQEEQAEEKEKAKQSGMNVSFIRGRKEMEGMGEKVKKAAQENRKLLDDLERVRAEREVWKERGAEKEDEVVLKNKEIEIMKRNQTKDKEELGKIKDLLEAKNSELEKRRRNEEDLRLEGMRLGEERLRLEGAKMLAEKERDHARKLAEDDRTYLKEDLEKKNKQIGRLTSKMKALRIEADDLEFKVYNLEKKLQLAKEIEDKLNSNIEVKDAKIEDLKSQVEYMKKQVISVESQESLSKMDLE